MTFSNIESINRAKFLLIRIPLILTLIILVLQMVNIFSIPYLLISSASFTVLAMISTLVLRMFYVNVEISQDGIIIKYYHLFPLVREFQMIEIGRGQLAEIDHKKSWGGMVSVMEIQVKTNRGVAKYPEIPLTLFKKHIRGNIVNEIRKWL